MELQSAEIDSEIQNRRNEIMRNTSTTNKTELTTVNSIRYENREREIESTTSPLS